MTRERWLQVAVARMRPWFYKLGLIVPDLQVSVGFALGKRKAGGQCWSPRVALDEMPAIFVSPTHDDPAAVVETLLHEMIHATVGTECGHKGAFVQCATKLGFTAPWTTTPASPALKERVAALIADLPKFPHRGINTTQSGEKKQPTRMLRYQCMGCKQIIRAATQTLEVICRPCNQPFQRN